MDIVASSDCFSEEISETSKTKILNAFQELPLAFVPNAGQVDSKVCYHANGSGCRFFFTPEGAVFSFIERPLRSASHKRCTHKIGDVFAEEERTAQGFALFLSFIGANPTIPEGRTEGAGQVSYFIGNDPDRWHAGLPTFKEIIYRDLWPNVDLVFKGESGQIKYEFIIHPGADINSVRLAHRGTDDLSLDEQGNLLIKTPFGILTDERPVSTQLIDGRQVLVESAFLLERDENRENILSLSVGDRYDSRYPLVIDPGLIYSTYLGGSSYDEGFGIAIDAVGNAYITGFTSSTNFPVTPGAFQAVQKGSFNAFVTKLNATGTALVYSTYLGGSATDIGSGIAIDAAGSAYVTGPASSNDFPVTPGAFQTTYGGGPEDAFITKLNTTGTALVYSTYLGGSGDDGGNRIAIDISGIAYVTGFTDSGNFPHTSGAFQTSPQGGYDAFVTKLNAAGTALIYSTYLGGSGDDAGFGIAADISGSAYITGFTASTNFPTTPGAFQTALAGTENAYITKLNAAGTALVYSTYLGGNGIDSGDCIVIDAAGNTYVTGETSSTNFPVTPGAFQATYQGGPDDAFVTRLNTTGTALVYSTYLGGSGDEGGTGITIDASGNAYVIGFTSSTNFPVTPGAFQATYQGGDDDAFVTRLNTTGTALVYSTYLGGSGTDFGFYIAIDAARNAYVVGFTYSTDFPVTPGAFQSMLRGPLNAFITKLSTAPLINVTPPSLDFGNVVAGQISLPKSLVVQNVGALNLTIFSVTITGTNAAEFLITSDPCTGSTLTPGATCTIMVVFAPTTVNPASASLVITSNAANDPVLGVPLSGNGVPAPPTAKDCILVNKVYDQCFTEEMVSSQMPLTSACPGVTIPAGATVGCIPIPGSATCTFAGTVAVTPPLTPFFEEVLVLNSFDISTPILVAGVTVCSPTITLTGAARADLWAPPGTTVACDILSFGDCTCTLLASPTGLPAVLACTGKICKEIQITAPVKLLVPSYGFCDVLACTFLPQSGFACPPEPLFPPQRPVPPAISKVFGAASIPLGSATSLTFTIINPNTDIALTGVGFTDTLPAGLMVVAVPPSACGASVMLMGNVISLAGVTLAASASCTFSIEVEGIAGGTYTNVTSAVTSNEAGAGNVASASLTVIDPPVISKVFGATSIPTGMLVSLTFTITNPNPGVALTGVAFTDTLPAGMAESGGTISACGGTVTQGTSHLSIILTGGTLAAGASCSFSVDVVSGLPGLAINTTNPVTSTNGGTGNTATASIMVTGG